METEAGGGYGIPAERQANVEHACVFAPRSIDAVEQVNQQTNGRTDEHTFNLAVSYTKFHASKIIGLIFVRSSAGSHDMTLSTAIKNSPYPSPSVKDSKCFRRGATSCACRQGKAEPQRTNQHQRTNQPTNKPTNQPINQSTNEPTNQRTNEPTLSLIHI